jgi:hypothetical protein
VIPRLEPAWLTFVVRPVLLRRRTTRSTIAGISLAAEWGGGLYWLAPTALPGIVGAVYNA